MTLRRASSRTRRPGGESSRRFTRRDRSLTTSGLARARAQAELRNIDVAVAYIDIDDFKAFNTKHTEPVKFINSDDKLNVSMGFVLVEPNCHLTEAEIRDRAAAAKRPPKGRIATFSDPRFEAFEIVG